MTLLTAAPKMSGVDPVYKERLEAYVDDAVQRDIRIAECITDAKGDRTLPPSQQADPDVYVHVVDRKPDGVVIRGAKLHISAASLVHDLMVMPTKAMKPGEDEYAIAAAVPVSSPGVRIVNTTFHPAGDDTRHYPVSSVHSMPDGFVIFDDVFVPHERVFLDGEVANATVFAHALGLWERLGGLTAMVIQAEQLVGLAQLIAEANGLARVAHVRDKIDEMIIHASLLRAGLEAAVANAHVTPEGYYYPDELYTNVAKYQGAAQFHLMVRHLHDIAGGAVLTSPTIGDLENPDTGPFVDEVHAHDGRGVGGGADAPLPRHPRPHRGLLRRLAPGDQPAVGRWAVRPADRGPQALRHGASEGPRPRGGRACSCSPMIGRSD